MAPALVFIFLLDYLPGNTLNRTLESITPLGHHITGVRECGRSQVLVTDHILHTVNQQLKVQLVPRWQPTHDPAPTKDSSEETLYQLQNVLEDSGNYEKPNGFPKIAEDGLADDRSECEIENAKNVAGITEPKMNVSGSDKVSFPGTVPYLVAIFETLSNVTAQTCGGTVVAPHWVLTAASCINLLGNLYNTTDQTAASRYTVVSNASDPLSAGAAHAVTRLHLHPGGSPTSVTGLIHHLHHTLELSKEIAAKETREEETPVLALMRVEPAVPVDCLEILGERLPGGAEVAAYGWELTKNSTGKWMRAGSFPAKTLSPAECAALADAPDSRSTVCLSTANDTTANDTTTTNSISQMSSGGPVVWRGRAGGRGRARAQLVGVAQADERAPLVAHALAAHALAAHAPWVHRIITT